MTEIRGARALVTGATGGLGRAVAVALAERGCLVVVSGRQPEPLRAVAAAVGGRAVPADLSQAGEVARLLDEAGELDILVANAALPGSGDLAELDQAQIERVLEVNLASPIALTRALLPRFRARGSGHFVFVSSLSGKVASPASCMYSATKFGLRGFALGCAATCRAAGSAARWYRRASCAMAACSPTRACPCLPGSVRSG